MNLRNQTQPNKQERQESVCVHMSLMCQGFHLKLNGVIKHTDVCVYTGYTCCSRPLSVHGAPVLHPAISDLYIINMLMS